MAVVGKSVIGRVGVDLEEFINYHILGLRVDPGQWPAPADADALPVPPGIDCGDKDGAAWILDREKSHAWHHARTPIGAHAYRFEQTEDYDCGWRLVNVAYRFLSQKGLTDAIDLVTILPPAPVYRTVHALDWLAPRLAAELDVEYAPELLVARAPIGQYPDLVPKLPVIPIEFYRISEDCSVDGRRILLVDWRWHRGKMITLLARRLQLMGADVVRTAWLD